MIPYFLQKLPSASAIHGSYVEPFAGGASVFFFLKPERARLSDINGELITLYKGIKQSPEEVWRLYISYPSNKEGYYSIREMETAGLSEVEKAARTLYLNRTCFKGMWRHNLSGKFNVGYGGQDRRWVIRQDDLLSTAAALRKTDLTATDFEDTIDASQAGDYLFLDPPYAPGRREMKNEHYQYCFFHYENQRRLADCLARASRRGVKWLMTNSNHGDILKLYKNYSIQQLEKGTGIKPGIASKNPGEIIVSNI